MNKSLSTTKLTRAGAIILAVITLLSTIIIIPASAKTGDPATITFDYAYDTSGNIITYHGTVTHDGITVGTPGEELCRIYADGKDAYCIQPGYSLYSGNTLIEGQSSVWDGVSKDKQKAVNIALLYGKPGNAKNLGGTDGQKWIATQVIVWEILCGCRNTGAGFKCTNTKFIDALTAGDHNPGVKSVYNTIANAMANHHTVPSFASNLASSAPTHTMQYSNGTYSVTLTDNNGVLSQFAYKTSGNIAVSISGNKMTLSTNSPITEEKTLAINKTVPTVNDSVLVAFGDSYKQDVIVGVAAPDPVPSVFKLKTSGGHLKIVKTSEDGNIANIEFTVTGDNYKQTAKTNDKGELVLTGLTPGTYTVTEAKSDKYVEQPPQKITVENGKTAEVKFHNSLNKGGLSIIKTSEDGIVADIEFTVTGSNYNKTAKTDKNGRINLPDLLPGTYTVTETPSDRYVAQEPKTVTVEYGKTASVSFENKLKKGNLDIIKTSEDGVVADIEFTVKGSNYNKTAKTDKDGKLHLTGLLPGKYTVTETPSGRYVVQEPQTVTVEYGKTATVTFKNVLKKSEITIVKKDAESKKTIPLAGFGFRIQKADGSYVAVDQKDVFFTDSTGTIKLPVKLAFGSYKLIEVQAGTGYVLDGTPISFTVDGTKTVIELVKYNNVEKGTITITKTGDIFASVTEEEVTEPTTEPSATEETTAPAEESTTTPETTTIPAEESTAPTEPSETDDRKPVIKYQPVYKNGGLADAEFTITAAEDITTPDGTVHFKTGEVVDTITTGKDGTAKTKALYLGKYTITETKNPFGYVANPETYTVEIKYAGQNVEVTNTDLKVENIRQKAEITLQKVLEKYDLLGIGDNGEIANVAFALFADEDITAADGKVIPKDGLIEIINCDENGKVRFNTEIPFGKYYVQEYSTDKHYIIDSTKYPFEFAYTPDTDVQHFDITSEKEIINELKRGTVYTTKVDEEYPENKLSGAAFEIYADIDGDKQFDPEVDKLVGEMKEVPVKPGDYYLTDLPVGGFFLCEKEAPAGFEKDDNYYYFEITEDGDEVTVENKAGVGFVNKPTTGELEITKKDVATGKPLPKAGFRIKDADGKVVAEGYTDENGVARFKLRAGKYTYEEFDAPEGYIIDTTPHEFEITEDGQIVKAEMTNEKESTPDTPQTGDSSMTGFFIGLGALALGGLVACVILFLKKKKDDGDDE
ncbi:MAG: SpaA isopeptide-forming pilin-related protein [Ruminococcus sp.]|nr:SpaA isopeptide-forming pilin-related protein [Ruminococcus sp.]